MRWWWLKAAWRQPGWRAKVGWVLRSWADRLDHEHAPRGTHWTFTQEAGGVRFREDGRGCRVWYLGHAEYDKAHNEADTEHDRVDWATMTVSRVGGTRLEGGW